MHTPDRVIYITSKIQSDSMYASKAMQYLHAEDGLDLKMWHFDDGKLHNFLCIRAVIPIFVYDTENPSRSMHTKF